MLGQRKYDRRLTCFLGLVALAACGGGDGGAGAGAGDTEEAAPAESPVDAATAGNVAGTVAFEGAAPTMSAVDMSGEPDCAAKYADPPTALDVIVNDNGTLSNVFIYVKEGLPDLQFPTPGDAVVLDQDGCRYHPHVFGLQVNQTLTIRNSDGLLHNINATPTANRGFNISQPVNMDATRSFPVPEVMIPIRCDVHGWMSSYVGILGHPYFSISGSDGSFDMSTLPPGDYVVEAWHERYGTQTQNVTVASGQTAEVSFTFSEDMALSAVVPLGAPLVIPHHPTAGADH
jgi:hypothetical protein